LNREAISQRLFEITLNAIQRFQENPSAIVLFPNLIIPDSRIIEGWYGPIWSIYNAYTLSHHFRDINPWFNVRVVSISEISKGFNFQRKIALHFTYNDTYSMFL
jgi:hypothetical protein